MLEHVEGREHLATEAVDERIERQVDRLAPVVGGEGRLGAADADGQHLGAEGGHGASRLHVGVGVLRLRRGRLSLAGGAGLGTPALGDRSHVVERLQEQIEHKRVELRPPALAHQRDRLVERKGGAIDAVARDGVEDVRDSGDPPLERDRLAGDAAWIAGAVEALVVRERDRGRDVEQFRRRICEQAVADLGVPLHHAALGLGQGARLEQDPVRDRDLADVVEAARESDQLAALVVQLELAGEQLAVSAHALGMSAGLGAAELCGEREPADGLSLAQPKRGELLSLVGDGRERACRRLGLRGRRQEAHRTVIGRPRATGESATVPLSREEVHGVSKGSYHLVSANRRRIRPSTFQGSEGRGAPWRD